MLRRRFESAALPLDVRKGKAFPLSSSQRCEAAPHLFGTREAQPHESLEPCPGKAKPFRTSAVIGQLREQKETLFKNYPFHKAVG